MSLLRFNLFFRDVAAENGIESLADILERPWRVGRKLGRTVYVQISDNPDDVDLLVGMMDAAEIAEYICEMHNGMLEHRTQRIPTADFLKDEIPDIPPEEFGLEAE